MKIKLFIILLTISTYASSQTEIKRLKGQVIDEVSKEPITDALLIYKNSLVGFTDIDGNYNITIKAPVDDFLTIKHFSFETKKIKVEDIKDNIITLISNVNELEEVLIGFDDEANEIIKKASKLLKKNFRNAPYWSKANLKQVIKINDTLPSYLEGDYSLFMVGADKDVWNMPILVPENTRRTKEYYGEAFGDKKRAKSPFFYSQNVNYITDFFLTSYRFSEFNNPLLRKRNYAFSLDDTILIDGESYYVISYKSLKEFNNIKERDFYDIQGEILLSKKTLSLKRITSLHKRSLGKTKGGVDNIFTIDYSEIGSEIFPKSISYNIKMTTEKASVETEGILSLNNIKTEVVENLRNTISPNRYLFHSSEIYNNYDIKHWNDYKTPNFLETKYFGKKIESKEFLKGSLQIMSPKDLYPGTKENEQKILELMPKTF
ncbi:carboxypeptidase-like regulatory domain-containing protein [Winogradskyella sp. PAMC22761]|nr:carboxypeptidase-like regulatory domain-containing protein [Winogradskyella sp. PAMC22761]